LPLPQGIGQEDHDDLGGNGIEAAGAEVAQIIEAFQLPMAFFQWPDAGHRVGSLEGLDGLAGGHERPVMVVAVGVGIPEQDDLDGDGGGAPTGEALEGAELVCVRTSSGGGRGLLGAPLGQRFLAFGFPALDELGPARRERRRRRRWLGLAQPSGLGGQRPGIGPEVHVLLHRDEHVAAPVAMAPTDAFSVNKAPMPGSTT